MTQSLLLAVPLLLALEGVDAGVRAQHRRLPGNGNNGNKNSPASVTYPDLNGADSGQYTMDERLGFLSYYYEGNPNCESFGYDFGVKIDAGCPYSYDSPTSFADNGLELTNQVSDHCSPTPLDLGTFKATCSGDNKVALTLPLQDHVVIMKGSNGGVIYSGLDGSATLDVGQYTKNGRNWIPAISHIEFCFNVSPVLFLSMIPRSIGFIRHLTQSLPSLLSYIYPDSVATLLLWSQSRLIHHPATSQTRLQMNPLKLLTLMLVLLWTKRCSQ